VVANSRKRNITEFIESPFNSDLRSFIDKYYFKSEPGLVENNTYPLYDLFKKNQKVVVLNPVSFLEGMIGHYLLTNLRIDGACVD